MYTSMGTKILLINDTSLQSFTMQEFWVWSPWYQPCNVCESWHEKNWFLFWHHTLTMVSRGSEECSTSYSDRPDVVLIMGFAATHGCWEPQLQEGLLRPRHANTWPRSRVLLIDNRGVGRSGSPEHKHAYTTTIMAKDVLGLLVRLP